MAIIIGLMYYASMSPWFANLGFSVLYRPLIAGTLVGIVMGRPAEGIAIGANINVLYLGWISAGGSLPGDPGLAGYLGTALVLGGGLGIDATIPFLQKWRYERCHYPSDMVDLKRWFTDKEIKSAKAQQGEYAKVLAKYGWG